MTGLLGEFLCTCKIILWKLRFPLGVLSLIAKEFKNGLKQKLKENFNRVCKKYCSAHEL